MISRGLLGRAKTENLVRLARFLGIECYPPPRRGALILLIEDRIHDLRLADRLAKHRGAA